MAAMDPGANRPFKYGGKITFDIPGVNAPVAADFVSGGANRGSAPFGDYPITDYVPRTKNGLQGFALNNVYGSMPDPKYPNAPRSDIMLHLDPRGRTLDKLRSSGCLSVPADEWPALRDQIVSLQKQGYKLVAHLDASGQVAIRTADSTSASPVSSTSDFIAYTNETRQPTRDLQNTLAKAGFNPGKIDGINGPQTTAAVKAFQQANGLKPDGIVGPQTSTVMAAYGSGPQRAPPPPTNTTFGGRLPAQAANGVDRLSPGKVTRPPVRSGHLPPVPAGQPVDARTLSLAAPFKAPFVSEDHPRSNAVPALPSAPTPFPGRPAALNTPAIAPQVPQQAAPQPLPQQRTAPMAPAPLRAPTVTLASGKQITPGVYNQGDHNVQVSDDGTGRAKIDIVRGPGAIPGLIDPMKEMNSSSLAGMFIRSQIPQALGQGYAAVKDNIGSAVGGVGQTAQDAVNGLGSNITGLGSTIGNAFGGFFGQRPPTVSPWAPAGSFYFPPQRQQVQAPVPRSRPFSLFAPQQQQRVVSVPVARSAPQVAVPQSNGGGGQQGSSQTYARAQQDLRDAGVLNSFGQMIHT